MFIINKTHKILIESIKGIYIYIYKTEKNGERKRWESMVLAKLFKIGKK